MRDPYLLRLLEEERVHTKAYLEQFLRNVKPPTEDDLAALREGLRRHDEAMEKIKRARVAAGLPIDPPELRHD